MTTGDQRDSNGISTPAASQAAAGNDSPPQPASHADHGESTDTQQNAAQPQQQATPAASTIEAGNVLSGSPAAVVDAGPVPVSSRDPPVEVVQVGRQGGRFVSLDPNKRTNQPEPKDPRLGEKAQRTALLNSPKSSDDNELERRDTRIGGLSDIPKAWKELPGNVSLGQEIAWVQSERLRVVIETPRGGIRVDLSKARVPAPSMSALSWLETSIRSYAKFIEVASKQASSGQDEAEFVRKERMAIGEIRSILSEMLVDKGG